MKSQLLIGATSSGSGKTTLTLGLLRALKNKGLNVQSFKCGPDYIDTKYHKLASGKDAINLDLFLSSGNHVKSIYRKYTSLADVSITEGVMGLFDGYDKMHGSSAQIAELLNIPIILMLNAKSMAYSVAPILYGFKHFHKNLNLIGAVFNRVNTASHYSFLCDACKDVGITPLGYLPNNDELEIPSRHLGLNIDEHFMFDEFADRAAAFIAKHINLDQLLELTKQKTELFEASETLINQHLNIAVAQDEAFNFVYHENIDYLKQIGKVIFFSPIHDEILPKADFIYLPGGYPELYLEALSRNETMKKSIIDYVEKGGKLWAECGGMMYLSESIVDQEGHIYPMVGIFEQRSSMEKMKLKLGYRSFKYKSLNIKGHEFHYSTTDSSTESIAQQYNAKKMPVDTKLLRYKNAIAGYTHIYWAELNNFMDVFND